MGKSIHNLVREMINYYENRENPKNKGLFEMMDINEESLKIKNEINSLLDGFIATLVNEFGESEI